MRGAFAMAIFEVNLLGNRNKKVKGIIRPVDPFLDTLLWVDHWYPAKYNLAGRPLFEDSHWRVDRFFMDLSQKDDIRVLVLEAENQIQGFIVFVTKNFRGIDGASCVYVAFLATAPWNRVNQNSPGAYRGVGSLLLGAALVYGHKHNNCLCLELHSLKGAEGFYTKVGMVETGHVKDEMKGFRLDGVNSMVLMRPFLASVVRSVK